MAATPLVNDLRCVREPDLQAYVLGDLPPRVERLVAEHLETCAACEAKARQLDHATDAVIRGIRRSHGGSSVIAASTSTPDTRTNSHTELTTAPPGYEIVRELGRGGVGVVYLARQRQPQRMVAIKVLLSGAHSGPAGRARFLAEADAIARLQHPNIVQIHEVGEHHGLPFLVLEYVEGGSLHDRFDGQPQDPQFSAELVRTLALAIDFAHQQGIVHRDLKPGNILAAGKRDDPDDRRASRNPATVTRHPQFKIADFGLAKQAGPELTATGELLGTPNYMAPEQAMGRDIGPPCDIWALGAILYECLTGRPPFSGTSHLETLEQVRLQEPVTPTRLQPRLPRDLETICLTCLHKEPKRRYATAATLADDLGRYLEHRPIRARPARLWERVGKWARRRPAVATLLGVVILAALSIVGVVAVYTSQLRSALKLATERQVQLQAANERADKDLLAARAAVRAFLGDTGEAALRQVPRMEKQRHKMLEAALTFYQGFLRDHPDDPTIRFESAQVLFQVGLMRSVLWQFTEARAAYREAIGLLTGLRAEFPNDRQYERWLARCNGFLAHSLRTTGDYAGAAEAYERAIRLCEALAAERPNDGYIKVSLANHLLNICNTFPALGREAEIEPFTRRAVDFQRAAYALDNNSPNARSELALGLAAMADIALSRDANQAKDLANQALELWQGLARQFPKDPSHRDSVAGIFNFLADLCFQEGKLDEAAANYKTSIAISEKVIEEYPDTPNYCQTLVYALSEGGRCALRQYRYADAVDYSRRAIAEYRRLAAGNPDQRNWKEAVAHLAHRLAWLYVATPGRPFNDNAAAQSLIEEAIRLGPDQDTYWRTQAAVHLDAGRWSAALTAADKSLSLKGDQMTNCLIKSMALAHLDKPTDAKDMLDKAKLLRLPTLLTTTDPILNELFSQAEKLIGSR